MRNLCYPQDLYVKKKEEIYNIYRYIHSGTRCNIIRYNTVNFCIYMYVKKKTNRNGERLVYNCPQNLVIQNDVVWTEIYVMKVCSFLCFVVLLYCCFGNKRKIYIRSFIVIYIITDGPRSIRYRSPVVRSWKDGSPGWSGVSTGSGSSYQKRPRTTSGGLVFRQVGRYQVSLLGDNQGAEVRI